MLTKADEEVRGALTRMIAEQGHAPAIDVLAAALGRQVVDVEASLRRLADAHALLLHPGEARPWAVHPFALAPGGCWVKTPARGYWANCVYCGFGIAAALKCDATVVARYGGEADTVRYEVKSGCVAPDGDLFHLSTPPSRWWPNVVFACSTFQPFRSEGEIDRWCADHDLPRGGVMTIPQLWGFASEWYGGYLDQPWRKRSPEEAKAVFARHGLTSDFWSS